MKNRYITSIICFIVITCSGIQQSYASQLYWVGGSGLWDDPSHWSSTSGGAGGTILPDADTDILFDTNSGLTNTSKVDIPVGVFHARDFVVTGTPATFKIRFLATFIDVTEMNVYGDLRFISTHSVIYGDGYNKWIFHGESVGSQNIQTAGQNMNRVELANENVNYHLTGAITCTQGFIMDGGHLNTNNFSINAGTFGANTTMVKTIDAGVSVFNCNSYSTKFTNGSFEITGNYTIKTETFEGASSQGDGHTTHHPKVLLKDYEGGTSLNDNNFECQGCVIDELIIENSFTTIIAGSVTIEDKLEIVSPGTSILFNTTGFYGKTITLKGTVTTPSTTGCDSRTRFQNWKNDFSIFKRQSGTLTINDARLKNIQTSGTATFIASNCLLMGNSSGWTETSSPPTLTYLWRGNSGVDTYWDNPDNWILNSGNSNGCIPTIKDHVIIDNFSQNEIRIRDGSKPTCNDFIWTKSLPYQLYIEGDFVPLELHIAGDFDIPATATVTGINQYQLTLISNENNDFKTSAVPLPRLDFEGGGSWKFFDDLNCDRINFYEGTIITNDINITTDNWGCFDEGEKNLYLGSSHIKVNDRFILEFYTSDNVHIFAGTSLIEVDELITTTDPLYDVVLTNSVPREWSNHPITLNSLTLRGSGPVTVQDTITMDSLIFETNDAQLILHKTLAFVAGGTLVINESIVSETTAANPAIINTEEIGYQREIAKPEGNLCVIGPVSFQDIDAQVDGVMHAPDGIDAGNNAGINFASSPILTPLYWIGNSGVWNEKTNWSNFSGGCPVDKNPNTALKLIFDENSFLSDNELITVPFLTNCKTMEFLNHNHPASFDIQTRLNPLQIFVNEGTAHFEGYRMYIQVKTVVNDGGTLSLDILPGEKYDTPTLEMNGNSSVIVKSETLLKVRN